MPQTEPDKNLIEQHLAFLKTLMSHDIYKEYKENWASAADITRRVACTAPSTVKEFFIREQSIGSFNTATKSSTWFEAKKADLEDKLQYLD